MLGTEKMYILDWMGAGATPQKLHIFKKIGWVVAEHGKNQHILKNIGWVVTSHGKNMQILEKKGWVGVFFGRCRF